MINTFLNSVGRQWRRVVLEGSAYIVVYMRSGIALRALAHAWLIPPPKGAIRVYDYELKTRTVSWRKPQWRRGIVLQHPVITWLRHCCRTSRRIAEEKNRQQQSASSVDDSTKCDTWTGVRGSAKVVSPHLCIVSDGGDRVDGLWHARARPSPIINRRW